jgi:hypothetical protein
MIKFQNVLLVVLTLTVSIVSAQDFKFGKVSKEELSEKFYAKDSAAVAAVLYRSKKIRYNYIQGNGFDIITEVHGRIKIYSKEGFDYATISEQLYKNSSGKETLSGLKAFTYNLENGSIVKQKMAKSGVFSTALNKNRDEKKFTLPNLKEGSVVEFIYSINSPFAYNIDEIVLQYDIPIKNQEVSISTPEYFTFKPLMKGYLFVKPEYSTKFGKISFNSKSRSQGVVAGTTFSQSQIDYRISTTDFKMTDVPALKEEPFVNDMDNYRSAVKYELLFVQFPESIRESYTTTWEAVVKKIYESDNFGEQLKSNKYFKDDLATIKRATNSNSELMTAIFLHVQKHMTWNSIYGYYADKGVKKAYKEKTGNIADINLMLTSMLQTAGLDANPVLVSTRGHGVPMFPTREGFNYVVASVQLNGVIILLDATNKYTKPNLLPTRALNWFGKLIKKDATFSTLNLLPQNISKENTNMSVQLMANGGVNGKLRKIHADYNAYMFRNNYGSVNEDDYLEKLENNNDGMEISDYVIKNKNTIGKAVIESFVFDLDSQADVVGDKIYFLPMFHMTMKENPFKLEERNYPIDFTYPWQDRYLLNIILPEGYEVTYKPEDVNLVLAENLGGFKYKIVENGKTMQLMVDLKINQAIISQERYAEIKELFKNSVEKQTEKVVLSKI